MRGFIVLWLMVASAWCMAQSTAADTTLRILTYGLPRFEYQNATWVVGRKWGIEHRAVAGCMVSQELVDSVKRENDQVLLKNVGRFGADWIQRFDADVEQEYEREKKVVQRIEELPYIQARQKEMESMGNGLHYWVSPAADGDEVTVHGYAPWEGQTEWLVLYTFTVDGNNGTVNLVSDTPWKE